MNSDFTAKTPIVMLIVDGMGIGIKGPTNPISLARTPYLNHLWQTSAVGELFASGTAIGLSNSEVSDTSTSMKVISSGRKVTSPKRIIDLELQEEGLSSHPELKGFLTRKLDGDGKLHLIGSLQPGDISENNPQFKAILDILAAADIERDKVIVHLVGLSGHQLVKQLRELYTLLEEMRVGVIGSVIGGKYVTADDNWAFTKLAGQHFLAAKSHRILDVARFFKSQYHEGDDFNLEPMYILNSEDDVPKSISAYDKVLFFDYDGADYRDLVTYLSDHSHALYLKLLGSSDPGLNNFSFYTAYRPMYTLPQLFSRAGFSQMRVAEANKFRELTRDMNWQQMPLLPGETFIEIPLGSNAEMKLNHDLLFNYVSSGLDQGKQVIFANVSLLDTHGHSGDAAAVTAAAEYLDTQVRKLHQKIQTLGGTLIVTADHGNAELNFDEETNGPHLEHTLNAVPFIINSTSLKQSRHLRPGSLIDIAPTVLSALNLEVPLEMEGVNLL